jgi:hypothetical protein
VRACFDMPHNLELKFFRPDFDAYLHAPLGQIL